MQLGEVVVVAPDSPQSGMGHAITVANALRLDRSTAFEAENILAFECSGTPADCVKLAKHHVLKGRKIDLLVSGINHGSNSSISVLYSGTMSAAIEGAMESIPSVGFSFCDHAADADFTPVLPYVKQIAAQILEQGLPKNIALNVNLPKTTKIKGIRVCRQAMAYWQEEFEERKDPYGRKYFWMAGELHNDDKGEDTDEYALAQGYVSVVPCQFDLTAHHALAELHGWKL
ncbi:MAG: 5'/3'-nucleotidase SurE [Verrucomicrobia bacterium]|nr:5'/3'-nucleotidase SurE [Cytophagales bacterium]